jgi:hypothetical protein
MRFLGVLIVVVGVAVAGCKVPCGSTMPPAQMMAHPGPGADGPGPGVMMNQAPGMQPMAAMTSQIAFRGPDGTSFVWDVGAPGAFDSDPLTAPGRYNFPQGGIYRLKMFNIPGRPGVELYPTLEVAPTMPRTEAFLAHNAIPLQFTEEDFDQVLSGNFVTKVIYLPDPQFQELALAGVETLVSTRLDPGVDPIVEAQRRGAILAIVRLGNKDLQVPTGQVQEGGVMQTSYQSQAGNNPMPGMPLAMNGMAATPSNYISGYNAPQYGMPTCGTPIGLPGPPSVPFGVPAGLQKHTMVNRTCVHMPEPTKSEKIVVKQTPGYSYPAPVDHVRIVERRGLCNGACKNGTCNNGEACNDPQGQCAQANAANAQPCADKSNCPTE